MTVPKEYISLAVSQLTESMYSGAKYSGFGRHNDGKFGSHSLQGNLGYKTKKRFHSLNISNESKPLPSSNNLVLNSYSVIQVKTVIPTLSPKIPKFPKREQKELLSF